MNELARLFDAVDREAAEQQIVIPSLVAVAPSDVESLGEPSYC
jgi:hypothetical protein